jgi:hypothetical protein
MFSNTTFISLLLQFGWITTREERNGGMMLEWIVERKNCIEEAEDMVQYLAFCLKVLGRCN